MGNCSVTQLLSCCHYLNNKPNHEQNNHENNLFYNDINCVNYCNKCLTQQSDENSKSFYSAIYNCKCEEFEKSIINIASLSESNPFYFEAAVEVAVIFANFQRQYKEQNKQQCVCKFKHNNSNLQINCVDSNRMLIFFLFILKKFYIIKN